jgi:hypothetical protein
MLDLLFLTCAGFSSLFVLSYIQIKENNQAAKHNIEIKAEFIITVTWPEDQDCDVDTYVQDPNNKLVFFKSREDGLMHLDRDDLGRSNDVVNQNGESLVEYKENREVVTIRGVIAGEYIVNIHMFAKRGVQTPTPVTVRLEKINPYKTVVTKKINLENTADEKTAFRFVLDRNGNVKDINEISKKIATSYNSISPFSPTLDYNLYPNSPYQ